MVWFLWLTQARFSGKMLTVKTVSFKPPSRWQGQGIQGGKGYV